jgi:hypothetical protein
MNLTDILDIYKNAVIKTEGDNIEFELRFSIQSPDEYMTSLKNVLKKSESSILERTINFIKSSRDGRGISSLSKIATMFYTEQKANGVSTVEKTGQFVFSSKKRIGGMLVNDDFVPYKIVIAEEEKHDKFDIHSFSIIRIKNRLSVFLPQDSGCSGWRLDFTLVKQLTDTKEIVSGRREMFLPGSTVDNFIDTAPIIGADKLELEAEYIGEASEITSADVYKIIEFIQSAGVVNYNENAKYQKMLHDVAKLIYPENISSNFKKKWGLKSFGISPKGLDKKMYFSNILPNITDYVVGEKAHGDNVIGYIDGRSWDTIGAGLSSVQMETDNKTFIYQAEISDGVHYIHDVMMADGINITNLNIVKRSEYIPAIVNILPKGAAVYKSLKQLTERYAEELKDIYNAKYPYEIDGLIFEHKNKDWFKTELYKWKPPEELTIDFLVMAPPDKGVIGIAPHIQHPGHKLLFLFCGINKNQYNRTHNIRRIAGYGSIFSGRKFIDYWPIQFSPVSDPTVYIYQHPNSQPLDIIGRICEFVREGDMWKFVRIRTDRDIEISRGSYFGNNIVVAESIWNSIKEPLVFTMLQSSLIETTRYSSKPYFGNTDVRYKPANAFSSFVKEISLAPYKGLNWIIDLAAGRGADLFRWSRMGIKNVLSIDNDLDALTELMRRQRYAQKGIGHYKTVVHTHHADLNDDYKVLVASIKDKYPVPPAGASLVVCNMAIHYMCETDLTISNFVMLVDYITAKNGFFIFTCYNGRRVFDLLSDTGKFQSFDGDALKYSIIRSYNASAFEKTGLQIHTLLGFTGGEHRMEYLVNIEYVLELFKGRGFKLVKHNAFSEHLEEYSVENLDKYDSLSEADVGHVGLFDYVVLQKIKDDGTDEKINKSKYKKLAGGDSFVVKDFSPLRVVPTTTKCVTSLSGISTTMTEAGMSQNIFTLNSPKLKIGDRMNINNEFDVVVHTVAQYPLFTDIPSDPAAFINNKGITKAREKRNGVLSLNVVRL